MRLHIGLTLAALTALVINIGGITALADSVTVSTDAGSKSIEYSRAETVLSVNELFTGLENIGGAQSLKQTVSVSNNGGSPVDIKLRLSVSEDIVNIYNANDMQRQLYSLWDNLSGALAVEITDENGNTVYTDGDGSAENHEYYKDMPLGEAEAGAAREYTLSVSCDPSEMYSNEVYSCEWYVVTAPADSGYSQSVMNENEKTVTVEIPIDDSQIASPISKSTAEQSRKEHSSQSRTEEVTAVDENGSDGGQRISTTETIESETYSPESYTAVSLPASAASEKASAASPSKTNPETGDNTPIGMVFGIFALSGIGMCMTAAKKKESKRER